MKSGLKKFILKLLLADVIIIVVILGTSIALIVPDCVTSYECEQRGYLVGQGLIRLVVFTDVVAGLIYYFKNRGKK